MGPVVLQESNNPCTSLLLVSTSPTASTDLFTLPSVAPRSTVLPISHLARRENVQVERPCQWLSVVAKGSREPGRPSSSGRGMGWLTGSFRRRQHRQQPSGSLAGRVEVGVESDWLVTHKSWERLGWCGQTSPCSRWMENRYVETFCGSR